MAPLNGVGGWDMLRMLSTVELETQQDCPGGPDLYDVEARFTLVCDICRRQFARQFPGVQFLVDVDDTAVVPKSACATKAVMKGVAGVDIVGGGAPPPPPMTITITIHPCD